MENQTHELRGILMGHYDKRPLSYDEQIDLLASKGLLIPDRQRTARQLKNISYYRLSAYMLPYKEMIGDAISSRFKKGSTWDMIYRLYVFDRKLRLLVFDAIERVEIAVRAQIIHQLSQKYGSHWQDNREIFKPTKTKTVKGRDIVIDVFSDIQKHIKEQLNNNRAEVFIQHYKTKYGDPPNPPSWMCVEIMYFKQLSRICDELKLREDVSGISWYFGLPPEIFCSWLHTINYVRNICAHHARLWNRAMSIVPVKLEFSKTLRWISDPNSVQRSRLYYFLCMLDYILQTANPTSRFKARLTSLLDEYKDVANLKAMGFPINWSREALWMWEENKRIKA